MPIITLTTDFGTRDGYVGAVKGVIARYAPAATIVDIAHDVPSGDIAHAAWVVATSTLEFPPKTIHVVVVDPGVGSDRPGVIARVPATPPVGEQLYVGPDNGVLAYLAVERAWRITNTELLAPAISTTFHGRDVFAPVAGQLATGATPQGFGPQHALTGTLPWGRREPGTGRVVHIDHYGNCITDLPASEVAEAVRIGARRFGLMRTFADVAAGEPLAYVGSAGTIEIGVRDGAADVALTLERGAIVHAISRDRGPGEGPYR